MKFVKAAIVLVGCAMYPPACCFAKAGAVVGAPGDVIQEEGEQVTSTGSVSIESNCVNIFNLFHLMYSNSVSYFEFLMFLATSIHDKEGSQKICQKNQKKNQK